MNAICDAQVIAGEENVAANITGLLKELHWIVSWYSKLSDFGG